jgi:acetaldehyde dehydrogenase (acetylating)
MSIHSQNEQVILEFGLHKPAFRIVVNSPATHGSVGLSTGLDPAMTLGCGGYGGNITSDNISPRHLLNIKRLAYEVSPVVSRWDRVSGGQLERGDRPAGPSLPGVPARPSPPPGVSADALSRRIDEFLGSRGFKPGSATERDHPETDATTPTGSVPMDFVCEEDVRLAIQSGQKLMVTERAIVTPAARDLGEQHRVFTVAPWRG